MDRLTWGFVPALATIFLGLFNSIMFPTIFTVTLDRRGVGDAGPHVHRDPRRRLRHRGTSRVNCPVC